jgi:hypothetical protein
VFGGGRMHTRVVQLAAAAAHQSTHHGDDDGVAIVVSHDAGRVPPWACHLAQGLGLRAPEWVRAWGCALTRSGVGIGVIGVAYNVWECPVGGLGRGQQVGWGAYMVVCSPSTSPSLLLPILSSAPSPSSVLLIPPFGVSLCEVGTKCWW